METSSPTATRPPAAAGHEPGQAFTAGQIAAALCKFPQTVRKLLRGVQPAGVRMVAGNEAAMFTLESLPAPLRCSLDATAQLRRYRNAAAMLSAPPTIWQPAAVLDQIAGIEIARAGKLRDALLPSLIRQHDSDLSAAEFEARGLADYAKVYGHLVTARHWRTFFKRTIQRDAGAENWNRLVIYLPEDPALKKSPARPLPDQLQDQFQELLSFIEACRNPSAPTETEQRAIWTLAFVQYEGMVNRGMNRKQAARRVRDFLFSRAAFLVPTRNALRMAFDRKLARWTASDRDAKALRDGREKNGNRASIPAEDIKKLRASAVVENGARINAAWREKYPLLSESTRARYPDPFKCPAKVYELVNRKIVNALHARHHGGKRALRKIIGGLHGDRWENIPAMYSWAMDDVTSNIEVAFKNPDGSTSLILPQIIAVMDSASRKWVGWSISNDKAPTASLVCAAALDGFRKNNIPKQLWVENGWVFGKSLLVNGKEDDHGRMIVAGLAQYGCAVKHYGKMNPQAKAELERSFEAVQRLMERHPGYTGRHQMIDAPEGFKREQRLINSGKVEATKFRYTFEEFKVVMAKLIGEYNSTPQHGHLKGLAPNEAFKAMANLNDPPILYDPELEWIFSNEKTVITVEVGGVRFLHRSSGMTIRVRGGRLVNLVGKELRAFVDREDSSMVTFMNLDFTDPFTMEVCQTPSAREALMAPGSGVLAAEISKIREHERAMEEQYNQLLIGDGNPRQELLQKARNQPQEAAGQVVNRRTIIDAQLAASAEQMQQQREQIKTKRKQQDRQRGQAHRLTQRTGIAVPERALESLQADDAKIISEFLKGKETP